MFRYGFCGFWRAFRIELPNGLSKTLDVCEIQGSPPVRLTDAALSPCTFIRQTLYFSLPEGWFLNQQSLPFVPLSGLAPLQNNGG
ncbi:MAG: hypothetical protein ACYTAO_05780 [Planctomycetota bacterium]